jgi:hypothetical protein
VLGGHAGAGRLVDLADGDERHPRGEQGELLDGVVHRCQHDHAVGPLPGEPLDGAAELGC